MKRGFTIVELLVVIAVMAILAIITVVGYGAVRDMSRDDARRAAAQQVGQAIKTLQQRQDEPLLLGGHNTNMTLTPNSRHMCTYSTPGSQSTRGWVYVGDTGTGPQYPCTIGRVLELNELVPAGFFANIPEVEASGIDVATSKTSRMELYLCNATTHRWLLLYYLKRPAAKDGTEAQALINSCDTARRSVISAAFSSGYAEAALEVRP